MTSSPAWNSPLADDIADDDAARPLSGPGTSRQTRRLQLRNANFQGSSLPTRKVTPQSQSQSSPSNWSVASGMPGVSDVENKSPGGTGVAGFISSIRGASGALQEISNASLPRPKTTRNRVSLGKLFGEDVSDPSTPMKYESTSPEGQHMSKLPRAVRMRTKNGHSRHSISTETRKYIEHLENELSTAQAQLSAATSPSVTREHSSKMRNLNAETKQLQEDLADWEANYDQRVQDEIQSYRENEGRLRSHLKMLEQEAEETKARMQDLHSQLETKGHALEIVETANVNLEKRLEIMSEILAAAPNKIDLHVEIPGRPRHVRPKSMQPRFPTAGALIASPDRPQSGHVSSPSLSHAQLASSAGLDSPSQHPLSPVGFSSDAESVFSESSAGMAGIENPWSVPNAATSRTRPTRRMRKFGAGSFGPKPLILPSTSSCEPTSVSAPPLDRNDGDPVFPFPPTQRCRSPDLDNHRSSFFEHDSIASRMLQSPMLNISSPSTEGEADDTLLGLQSPRTSSVHGGVDFSSLGPAAGRTLMDELVAVNTCESDASGDMLSDYPDGRSLHASPFGSNASAKRPSRRHIREEPSTPGVHHASTRAIVPASRDRNVSRVRSVAASLSPHHRPSSLSSASAFQRLHILFGDVWRNPVALARHLVHTAQSRMWIPSPLLNVQWWLVGVLLGPMARRRLLESSTESGSGDDATATTATLEGPSDANTLAYGTMYKTPPSSPDSLLPASTRSGSLVAGKGKKRTLTPAAAAMAAHSREQEHGIGFKHSPWLWLKFSITLAFAVGVAFRDGPASLLHPPARAGGRKRSANWRQARRDPLWVLTP